MLAVGAVFAPQQFLGQSAIHIVDKSQNSEATGPMDSGFGPLDTAPLPAGVTTEQLVAQFAAKESEFRNALANYTWQQDIRVQTLNDSGHVDGEYHIVYDVTFDSQKKRAEHVVFAPQNTLERILMTQNDVDDIEHRLPFVLTSADVGQYDIAFVGRQKVDDVETFVFSVKPKVMEPKKRYFQGRIWVDAKDHQIVIASGKNVPDDLRPGHEDLSPPFTTYREQVDGKYWFPTYTKGQGTLEFHATKNSPAEEVRIRQIVKYRDYKQFGSSIRLIAGPEATPEQQEQNK